ncbi:hypothetical protein NT239_03165 [Chitinibacter sp. SCUT-21]|uniref:hypothetical protein n=1 Tax=Chitinibacter sp. SCUT-21 TaxID=2970891 RepID=UPI0035A65A57
MKTLALSFAATTLFLAQPSFAGVFDVSATMNGVTASESFDNAEDAIKIMNSSSLNQLYNNYTGVEAVDTSLNFRGIPIQLAYPTTNQTTLTLNIPSIGVSQSFTGATRDESQALLEDYLKNNPDLLNKFLKESVKSSPVDPLAGNPNSLMSKSVVNDANLMWFGSQGIGSADDNNQFGIGINYSRFVSDQFGDAKSMSSDSFSVPLSYSHQFAEPNHELLVNIPLGYTTVEGSKAYDGSISFIYRRPVLSNWILSAAGAARATGSTDLAGGGWMASGALGSTFNFGGENWNLTVANMVGYYKAMKVKYDNTSVDPGISNTAFRNGLLFSMDSNLSIADAPLSWEAFVIDTRYTGTELFSNYQDEFGITFGTKRSLLSREADFRVGFTYLIGENVDGFKANFGTWF